MPVLTATINIHKMVAWHHIKCLILRINLFTVISANASLKWMQVFRSMCCVCMEGWRGLHVNWTIINLKLKQTWTLTWNWSTGPIFLGSYVNIAVTWEIKSCHQQSYKMCPWRPKTFLWTVWTSFSKEGTFKETCVIGSQRCYICLW